MSGVEPQENAILTIEYQVTEEDGVTPKDISSATALKFICSKPNGRTVTFNAAFKTNGADGYVQYTTVDGDLIPYGKWQLQVEYANPNKTRTEVLLFDIWRNLG